VVGVSASVHRAAVASSKTFHADQVIRFPFPANADVTSHPVKAWNAGSALHLLLPSAGAMVVASRYRNVVPVPKANHRHSQPIFRARLMLRTTTSVSQV
jgi:hypothetical protein